MAGVSAVRLLLASTRKTRMAAKTGTHPCDARRAAWSSSVSYTASAEAHPRPAVRRRVDRTAGQVPKVQDGRVAVQDLKDEQVYGDDRIELALSPAVPCGETRVDDYAVGKELAELPLDPKRRGRDALSHPWPPVRRCREETPLSQEAFVRASISNARGGAEL